MKNFNFKKNANGQWYIIIPKWEGNKEELKMIKGADTMLNILAQGENLVNLSISETPFKDAKLILTIKNYETDGVKYLITSKLHNFEIWVSNKIMSIFGFSPEILYIN